MRLFDATSHNINTSNPNSKPRVITFQTMKPIFALFLLVKGGLGFQFGSMKLSTIPLFHLEDELKKDRMSGVSRRNAFALGLAIASISQIPQETIAAMEVSEASAFNYTISL